MTTNCAPPRPSERERRLEEVYQVTKRHLSFDPQMLTGSHLNLDAPGLVHHDTYAWDDPIAPIVQLFRAIEPHLEHLSANRREAVELVIMHSMGLREAARHRTVAAILADAPLAAAVAAAMGYAGVELSYDLALDAVHLRQNRPQQPDFRACSSELERSAARCEYQDRQVTYEKLHALFLVTDHKAIGRWAADGLAELRAAVAQVAWVTALTGGPASPAGPPAGGLQPLLDALAAAAGGAAFHPDGDLV